MRKSYEKERLDTGDYTPKEYRDCLKKLGKIGKYLGGDRAGLAAFEKMAPTSILDVGCGGGYFAALLAKRFPQAEVVGIDLNGEAIEFAEQNQPKLPNLRFERQGEKSLSGRPPVDVVTATLVCHHMDDQELGVFLGEAKTLAKQAVILNDLHRSPIAYALFVALSPLFRNRLITEDGLQSIRRGFVREEWEGFFNEAGFSHTDIVWRRGFRWVVTGRP